VYQTAMKPRYREKKATQAAALLVRLGGGSMNYMKLGKLLYFAERASVLKLGRPILFDTCVSMEHGPVLSRTLDSINGKNMSAAPSWNHFISAKADFSVSLIVSDVPTDELSAGEERMLQETFAQFGHLTQYQLRDYAHDHFREWKNPGKSTLPISVRDILQAENYSDEDIADIEGELLAATAGDRLANA